MNIKKQIITIMMIVFTINTNAQSRVDDIILTDIPEIGGLQNLLLHENVVGKLDIFPDFEKCRKIYKIYYSSNENPQIFYDEFTIEQLQNHLFYKFKTKENCQKWCDNKNRER